MSEVKVKERYEVISVDHYRWKHGKFVVGGDIEDSVKVEFCDPRLECEQLTKLDATERIERFNGRNRRSPGIGDGRFYILRQEKVEEV